MDFSSTTAQRDPAKRSVGFKKNESFVLEQKSEVAEFLRRVAVEKTIDLEAWEHGLMKEVLSAGAAVLEGLLEGIGCGRMSTRLNCACGPKNPMESIGQRDKTLKTLFGQVQIRRSIFVCPQCGKSRCPADEKLGVCDTGFSPSVQRHMARAGSRSSFAEAAEDLEAYAYLKIDPTDIERIAEETGLAIGKWMDHQAETALESSSAFSSAKSDIATAYLSFDGTGIPMRREELEDRKGRQSDGSARTREVKLGCVFTQTTTDSEGFPIRDEDSTTYVGAIESSDAFGWRIFGEATRRGFFQSPQQVILTDGAAYNRSITETHFPRAIHIIDLYHAREHLHELAHLLGHDKAPSQWLDLLDHGKIENLVTTIESHLPQSKSLQKEIRKSLAYFQDRKEQMRYADFRKKGFFVGSGIVEAGCRSLIGKRLKQSGMFWSLKGANAIIASRCCQYSNRFQDFWDDALTLAA
jgi:hypothetical protein